MTVGRYVLSPTRESTVRDIQNPADIIVRRLQATFDLSESERAAIYGLPLHVRHYDRGQDLVREHDRPSQCVLILEGWIARYKVLGNGRRQVVAIEIPGDMPDVQSLYLEVMDHNLGSLTKCVVGFVPHVTMKAMLAAYPRIATAVWRQTLIDGSVSREWVLNVGAREAYARIAHVLCEIYVRLKAVGLTNKDSFGLPISQAALGEATGLSNVHVNRVMKALRTDGLVALNRGVVTILDIERLMEVSSFDGTYLHMRRSA